jgi:hypothetical protein
LGQEDLVPFRAAAEFRVHEVREALGGKEIAAVDRIVRPNEYSFPTREELFAGPCGVRKILVIAPTDIISSNTRWTTIGRNPANAPDLCHFLDTLDAFSAFNASARFRRGSSQDDAQQQSHDEDQQDRGQMRPDEPEPRRDDHSDAEHPNAAGTARRCSIARRASRSQRRAGKPTWCASVPPSS